MDPSIVSALSAILGSLVGGSASIAAAWFTQKGQNQRELLGTKIHRREVLYAEFITECSRLTADALARTLESPATLVHIYALLNQIRLIASDEVVAAAQSAMDEILEQYFEPNMSLTELRKIATSHGSDPLQAFSEACRKELDQIQRDYLVR
ncbi:hypothetical protein [Dechloromonas sp. H13]|uniref:hypothetical protein n=1 Tax=Dechloromonas sp. H13 TaxID=2570193 RepID=UPI0012924C1E|nr:hypothetical protein [Dechloromonas sp. H13]